MGAGQVFDAGAAYVRDSENGMHTIRQKPDRLRLV